MPIAFGDFRLDPDNARLLCAGRPVALTPKAFDVLHFLARRPDKLVSKDELLAAVWPDVLVSDASVKVCVREIRKALEDDAESPRYIQTVHRRGYRFIAPVQDGTVASANPTTPTPAPVSAKAPPLIGRESEMTALREHLARAMTGTRQSVFVTGGPGSGKTALVEAFAREVEATRPRARVLIGHCFEQFGTGEPYMPVWEALGRLAEEASAPPGIAALFERYVAAQAATPVASASEPPRGMSERLLREFTDGIEDLADDAPLVLVLEDLHWADYSTLDLVSALARRRHAPARLLVLATYRPVEVSASEHPLRAISQGLFAGGMASEVALPFLDETAVEQYLTKRFDGAAFPKTLSTRLHQRTDGHPLFLVHLVDDLIEQGVLVRDDGGWSLAGEPDAEEVAASAPAEDVSAWHAVLETQVPRTVRAMIELQLERLKDRERQLLEAAAVAGVESSAAAVAAALDDAGDVVAAEEGCDALAQRHRFLEPRGLAEWPDGTAATHYRFVHELYHNVVYERVPAARRTRMHRALGLRMEAAWGNRAAEEAATLAMHFEAGRDWGRAIRHLRQAATAAGRQYAHREAVRYLRRALDMLERLPAEERTHHELPILIALGVNLQVTDGFSSPESREVYGRARAICQDAPVHNSFPVLWGVWMFHKVRSELRQADEVARRMVALADEAGDSALQVQAHQSMAVTNLCLGNLALAVEHVQKVDAIYDPVRHAGNAEIYGQDPLITSLSFGCIALWLMGRSQEALATNRRATDAAERLGRPSTLALSGYFSAMLHQLRGDADATRAAAERSMARAAEDGFTFWLAGGSVLRGWAAAVTGDAGWGLAEIRRGQSAALDVGSLTYRTYQLGLLADVLLREDRVDEAMPMLDEALTAAREFPEGFYEPELRRMKGHALRRLGNEREAAKWYECALALANEQGAGWIANRVREESGVRR